MRRDRSSPPEMLSAAAMTFSMGLKELLEMSQPPPTLSTTSAGSTDHASGTMTSITLPRAALSMVPRTHRPLPPISSQQSYTRYIPSLLPTTVCSAFFSFGAPSDTSAGAVPNSRCPSSSKISVYTPWAYCSTSLKSQSPWSNSTSSAFRPTMYSSSASGGRVTVLRFISITNTSISAVMAIISRENHRVIRHLMDMFLMRPPSAPSPCPAPCAAACAPRAAPASSADS